PRRLDVDTLNEELRIMGVARMRLQINPDAAFGMIFDFEGVIADTKHMKRRAWQKIAQEEGLRVPSDEQLDKVADMRLERAIMEVFRWSQDWSRAKDLAWRVASAYGDEFAAASEPQPGVREWLHVLSKVNVPCAVVSTFDRISVRKALEKMGILEFFVASVTSEDGMETLSQRFLCSAIKLARPPNQCVVFTSSLAGLTAAHNCTSKAVAVRRRQFHQADLSVVSLSELAVYNIRRLFANQGSEFMSLQQETVGKTPKLHRIRNATL
ncbi:HAD-like protein, partial [Coccomyxa subellipsoidea C-169]